MILAETFQWPGEKSTKETSVFTSYSQRDSGKLIQSQPFYVPCDYSPAHMAISSLLEEYMKRSHAKNLTYSETLGGSTQ